MLISKTNYNVYGFILIFVKKLYNRVYQSSLTCMPVLLFASVSANWILVFSSVFPPNTTNRKQFCFSGETTQILRSYRVTSQKT